MIVLRATGMFVLGFIGGIILMPFVPFLLGFWAAIEEADESCEGFNSV